MKYLTTDEVAALLAVAVSTVRQMCQASEIPAVRVGGQWRIAQSELETWLEVCSNSYHEHQKERTGPLQSDGHKADRREESLSASDSGNTERGASGRESTSARTRAESSRKRSAEEYRRIIRDRLADGDEDA